MSIKLHFAYTLHPTPYTLISVLPPGPPSASFSIALPVERSLFIQICETLDLDWERVAGFEKAIDEIADPPSNKDARSLLASVTSCASAAREALNPRILERIDRAIVREKYLGVIQRSIAGTRRIIPELGCRV